MCLVDFGVPLGVDLSNGCAPLPYTSSISKKIKRKLRDSSIDLPAKTVDFGAKTVDLRNFVLSEFKDPVLFVSHLSEHSLFVVEKSWLHVARTFDPPVHRHIFGT